MSPVSKGQKAKFRQTFVFAFGIFFYINGELHPPLLQVGSWGVSTIGEVSQQLDFDTRTLRSDFDTTLFGLTVIPIVGWFKLLPTFGGVWRAGGRTGGLLGRRQTHCASGGMVGWFAVQSAPHPHQAFLRRGQKQCHPQRGILLNRTARVDAVNYCCVWIFSVCFGVLFFCLFLLFIFSICFFTHFGVLVWCLSPPPRILSGTCRRRLCFHTLQQTNRSPGGGGCFPSPPTTPPQAAW